MSIAQNTFKRYEKKYMLNKRQYEDITKTLTQHTTPDKFGTYSICNLYFDTDSYEIIRRSIEKPVYKEKLRVRSYGIPNKDDMVFFELKKKYKKEVFKRRIALTIKEYEDYIYNGVKPTKSHQILSEIDYYINMYKPYPRIYIAYEREALIGINNKNLRITFDKNIRYRQSALSLRNDDEGTKILDDDKCIMEIKILGAMPVWLSQLLTSMKIYPQSFSKYGYCYQNYLHAILA